MHKAKYNAKRLETPFGAFDSKREYLRWCELQNMEADGTISKLERQKVMQLIPSQRMSDGTCLRGIKYVADFFYYDNLARVYVVEDVKPNKNGKVPEAYKKTAAWKEYMIKKKLLLYTQGIEIREV